MSESTQTTVEQQLYQNCTIWITSVSSWSGKDKLKASDLGKDPDDILDIIELGRKNVIPDEVRINMLKPSSQVTSLMTTVGKRFFIRGAWLVPNTNFMQAQTGLEKIDSNQAVIVEDLIANLPQIKEEMIEKYPILEDAKWPTDQQIRNRFKVKWHVCEIRGAEINEADPVDLIAAKRRFQAQLSETYEEYSSQIMEQARTAMLEAIHEISGKIEQGQKITEGTMKKPKRVVDDYLNIAQIFDLQDVKVEIEKLKVELENTDASDIRGNWDFAQQFADKLKGMANDIGDISGLSSDGTVKRVVRKGGVI
uniref:Peptidase n=3 Tax=viral metagenome TaxID=1070528 RepID=A0A6H1ZT74_9ZZZZ